MSTDTLSEVLRALRLTGAVYFTVDGSAPWVAEAPASRDIGPYIMPGVEHVVEYHAVAEGTCWGGIPGEEAYRLEAGDVIVFPHGDAHVMSSAPGMRGPQEDLSSFAGVSRLPVRMRRDGGGSERTRLVCGFLGFDVRPFNPLIAALPRVIHLPRAANDTLHQHFVALALAESEAQRAGSEAVLARLSELLFVEVLRRQLAAVPPESVGWLAGLRDESIGRVLGRLHDRPSHDWDLEELARIAGLSRSVLAERFTHFVGMPPMQYLAQWRMQLASTLLSDTSLSIAQIADKVGYGSEAALSRAYKRWVGMAPSDWRRERRAAATPPPS